MSIIKNKQELCAENGALRADALSIVEAGLEAVDTKSLLQRKLRLQDGSLCFPDGSNLSDLKCELYERIFFIGIGKCALDGAEVIEEILGDQLTAGIAIDVRPGALKKIRSFVGTHPLPSEANIAATKEILKMVEGLNERDLVLVLISGGGSALLSLPASANLDCNDLIQTTDELTRNGADIYELNTVRKHLSAVHGGGLAKLLFPANVVSLIFSDVLGNDISVIASGPTVLDQTTVADARNVLEKYFGDSGRVELFETPKEAKYFERVNNILFVSSHDALEAMREKARLLGYEAKIVTDTLSGEAKQVGKNLLAQKLEPKTCLIYGGETVVRVSPGGKGGRNQELVLSALSDIGEDLVLIAFASDGWDNTPHAGALADRAMFLKSQNLGLNIQDFLARSDSFDFWQTCGGALCTGRLGSNVSDLVIMISNGK